MNMKENKTLVEVYNNASKEVQEILKSKFNNSELGLEIDKEEFKEYFLKLLGSYTSIKFLFKNYSISKLPTKHYRLLDENNQWSFDINLNPNIMHFCYSYEIIYMKLQCKFGGNYKEINELIEGVLDETLELNGLTPIITSKYNKSGLDETLELNGLTPYYI